MVQEGPLLSDVSRRSVLRRGALASTFSIGGLTAISGPVAAQTCDIVVPDDFATVQNAVNNASAGDTICIQPGTYQEDVTVDKAITLRGRNAPQSTNPATIDGQIKIEAAGSNTTVERLRITHSDMFSGGTFPDPAAVLIKASDVEITNNVIEDFQADLNNGQGSFSLHGVQIFGSSSLSGVTVRENVIRGFESFGDPGEWPKYGGIAGVKAQADVKDITVRANLITNHHSAGWVWGIVLTTSGSHSGVPKDVTVGHNHISDLNDGSEYDVFAGLNEGRDVPPFPGSAFGIDGDAHADQASVGQNNLLAPNGAESKDETRELDAKCNWWGDPSGPEDDDNPDGEGTWALERGNATIDYRPWLTFPSPSRTCNGR